MSKHTARAHRPTHLKQKRRWIRSIMLAVMVGLVGVGAAVVGSGRYQVRPVLSGSMRPGLPVGGVVITQRVPLNRIQDRDVIVFTNPIDPSKLVVHRVISLSRSGSTVTARTQGDANNTPDPWTLDLHGTSAYRAVYSLPLLGYPAVWLQNAGRRQVLLIIAGVALVAAAAGMWRKERSPAAGLPASPADERLVLAEAEAFVQMNSGVVPGN